MEKLSFLHSLSDALRGTPRDYTEIPVSRAVFLLAIPMVLEMAMESLFAIVDVYWVSRLGANSVAAVGLTESILALVYSVAMGVSVSATALVARRTGEKDRHGAAVAAVQAILLGSAVSIAAGIPGCIFAPKLLAVMGASPELIATGRGYTAIVLGGNIVVILLSVNNAVFRGAGAAAIAMRVLWGANLLNMLLGPLLIFGLGPFPRMGVAGAALATLIGRSCGVAYQFWKLARPGGTLRVGREHLRVAWPVMRRLIRISTGGTLQFAIADASWVALVRMISSFGSAAVAGYTIGIRVFIFVLLPSWGLSGAAATMVGQNLGARKPERAERAVWLTGFYNMLFLGSVGVLLLVLPRPIVALFTTDPAVIPTAVSCLRIIACGNLTYAYGMVMAQAFDGAGDTVTPTLINIAGFWLCEIPLAWAMAFHAEWGVNGVFASIPISEALTAVLGIAAFARGRWKTER